MKHQAQAMEKFKDEVWAIIPARGGSKSIPQKNMAVLFGQPLIAYVIKAAKSCKTIDRIICSTDDKRIEEFCLSKGIEVHKRPESLAGDDTPVVDVVRDILNKTYEKEGCLPKIIALLQPTSPFVLPSHIDTCIRNLKKDHRANSSQTVSRFPHNFHAYNQRVIKDGYVRFNFSKQRKIYYNKQTKPDFYIFGNLVATRTRSLLQRKVIFTNPSIPHVIPFRYAMDVDGPEDLKTAESMLKCKIVILP